MLGLLFAMGQQPAQQGQPAPNPLMTLLPFVVLFGIFYLFFILPQRKKQKEMKAMLDNLQRGDKVLTTGGLIGTIVGERENAFLIKIGEGAKVEVHRSYIVQKLSGEATG